MPLRNSNSRRPQVRYSAVSGLAFNLPTWSQSVSNCATMMSSMILARSRILPTALLEAVALVRIDEQVLGHVLAPRAQFRLCL
jgi:hypothetical protein